MKQKNFIAYHVETIALLLVSFLSLECTPVANYSPIAYEQAVTLKVESLEIMELATGEYSANEETVKELKRNLNIAYEFSKGRLNNEISTKQWEILLDPEKNLLGGFLVRWQNAGSLSEMFISEMKKIVSDAFDTIIGLEGGKIKPSEIN
ncbi:MAG: hypothetical protein IPM56_16535 [Ignavibacteriales bacterium]|nr:MAG: hypothetical protein IPM56_16535 [Ignavibacteriales bacterium]